MDFVPAFLGNIDVSCRPNVFIFCLAQNTIDFEIQRDCLDQVLSLRGGYDNLGTIIFDEEYCHETYQLAEKHSKEYCTEENKLMEYTVRHLHRSLFCFLDEFTRCLYREFYRLDEELMSTDFISRNLKLKKIDLDGRDDIEFDKMLEGPLEVNDKSLTEGCYKLHRLTGIHADVHAVALEANHLLMEISGKFNFLADQRQPTLNKSIPLAVGSSILRIDGVVRYSVAFERLIVQYKDREREDEIMSEVESILCLNETSIPVVLEYRKNRYSNIRKMSSGLSLSHRGRRGTLGMVASTKKSNNHVYRVGFTAAHIIDPSIADDVFVDSFKVGPCIWPDDFDNLQFDMAVIKIEKNIHRLDSNFRTEDGQLNHVRIHDSDVNDLQGQIVYKNGASTGFTKGTIIRIEIENTNDDANACNGSSGTDKIAWIVVKKTIDSFQPFCKEGDSGSIVFSVDKEQNRDDKTTVISILQGADKEDSSECFSCHFKPCIQKYEKDMNETVKFQNINV